MAVLSAWAEIQIQSTQHEYVQILVSPQISKLIPMWLQTLTTLATLQFEPEVNDGVQSDVLLEPDDSSDSTEFLLQVITPCAALTARYMMPPG